MSAPPRELNGNLELVLGVGADIGEGPIWDEESATLLFVDSTVGRIYRLDPASGALASLEAGQQVGVAIPRLHGGLVVSARDGLLSVDDATGAVDLLAPIEADDPDLRLNDAKCDSRGRLWSGSFSLRFERGAGSLYRVASDLAPTRVASQISISNGIAWSPDETLMYHVDSGARRIYAFDYNIETGQAVGRREFIRFDRSDGLPDGIAVDAEGHLWVALYFGGAVRRYSPSGAWVATVTMPVARVTSCGFGGPDLRDLYVTTATHLAEDDGRPHETGAGDLFRCRPGVTGLPAHRFAG